ncbi:MAG: hypothetical protein GXX88_07070, partial [Candidatus Hydrogenedentes bacterium]|nr:hypothetical protein [Candidatus Hydrogenedentota bacterium]
MKNTHTASASRLAAAVLLVAAVSLTAPASQNVSGNSADACGADRFPEAATFLAGHGYPQS